MRAKQWHLLRAPSLDYSRQVDLLRIVGDHGPEFEQCASEMSVGACHDMGDFHARSQGTEDLREAGVIEFLDERAVFVCRRSAATWLNGRYRIMI